MSHSDTGGILQQPTEPLGRPAKEILGIWAKRAGRSCIHVAQHHVAGPPGGCSARRHEPAGANQGDLHKGVATYVEVDEKTVCTRDGFAHALLTLCFFLLEEMRIAG